MLQITRQTEYAIRGLQELARRNGDAPVQLKSIARNCEVSEAFLAKIFQMLSQQSIVKSHRGVKGGFSLGRKPDEISLREIVEVCEGGIALNHCLRHSNRCENADECNMTEAWSKAQFALVGALEQTRLSDLL
ncbi:MAG TPA: Rrf2 family transcriptional regulator [Candidatus Krumholzibacteria bacterium]|nr:Rrf2 family transcriptional regulator [Candidatus Krumholzibacteria bacterium]HPD71218.1 Rrf2 family transcriptional regulator [Candidatus Krumholzibacteria bacterium]HRY39082.1 Rrf2 family transcriptional regulator [Candidatus Krumholzibacteria bacterium]